MVLIFEKKDFVKIRWKGIDCYALRPDYFAEEPIKKQIKEVFETKEAVEIEIAPSDLENNPPPEPKIDSLAKARAVKAAKKDALQAELEALE